MPDFCVNCNPEPAGEHEVHSVDLACDSLFPRLKTALSP